MLIFFTDESLADRGGAEAHQVSIYGGLILSEKTFYDLTTFLYQLKDNYVFRQEVEVKWNFDGFWDNLRKVQLNKSVTRKSHPQLYESYKPDFLRFKQEILEKVSQSDAEIIVAVRPNKLLNASEKQIVEYSIDAVARKFEKVLERRNECGIILADELPKRVDPTAVIDYQYVLQLCCRGSRGVAFRRLLAIMPTMNSHLSPIHQINDIILGALQFYVLEFIRSQSDPSRTTEKAKLILEKIVPKFHRAIGGKYVINNGVLMYPPKITRRNTQAGRFMTALEEQLKTDFGIM
jgi:hypothetical protein